MLACSNASIPVTHIIATPGPILRFWNALSTSELGKGVSDISISLIDRKLSKIYKIKFT